MGYVVLGGEKGWLAFSVMSFPFGCKCVCQSNLQSHVLFCFSSICRRPDPHHGECPPRFPTGKTISSDVVGIRLRIIPRARISWVREDTATYIHVLGISISTMSGTYFAQASLRCILGTDVWLYVCLGRNGRLGRFILSQASRTTLRSF